MQTRAIQFYYRNAVVNVEQQPTTRTVLQWLREQQHHCDTKEACAEGDCGACMVMVAELCTDKSNKDAPPTLRFTTMNSCIQFLPMLDGKALFTVQDLQTGDKLHPAQQAMKECNGSQCGFCTPGFVMSLALSYEQHQADSTRPNRRALADELSGNLCRCTGYRPILDAAEAMFEKQPRHDFDRATIFKVLQDLQTVPALHYHYTVDSEAPCDFYAPRTLAECADIYRRLPDLRILAGSTDIGLWVTKQFRALPRILYIGQVAELQHIDYRSDGGITINAAVTLEEAWRVLTERYDTPHQTIKNKWLRFASLPLRLRGTLVGGVANGSPIGDNAAILIALGANIILRCGQTERVMPLEDFYTGYMKNALQAGEFVRAVSLPPPNPKYQVYTYKIARRYDCDISTVSAAFVIEVADDVVQLVRLVYGGMAATVQRARHAEEALLGKTWSEVAVDAAKTVLAKDFTPLTDQRASADYRLRVAQNLLQRLYLQTTSNAAVSVWQ